METLYVNQNDGDTIIKYVPGDKSNNITKNLAVRSQWMIIVIVMWRNRQLERNIV